MSKEVVTAPIPGKVIRVQAQANAKINEGDTICEIESMKMENPITAPVSGVIGEINVAPGQVVKTGQTIAVINY
ncbi:MAG: acetyl-CoA carboxylase biotin carboxyl carrier protein subunit [Dehalococcoidia bacterium]|nr:acetyl-CoA carboxylase biotin carboxyl carrier protein subunit [Dehalococcoidia bacterium]